MAILVPLEVSQGLARHYASAAEGAKKAYASAAWTFLLLMLAGFLVLGQLFAAPLCILILGDTDFLTAFRVALVLMALNCVFYFLQNQCRWEFRTAEYVLISLVFAFLSLALSLGLGILIDTPLVGVVLGQALGAAAAVALGAFGLERSFEIRLDRDKLREMLRFSLPLVPASVGLFLSVYASRLILNGLTSLDEVGVYTLAAQIAGIATLGIVGVQSAVTPLAMAHHQDPKTPALLARLFEGFVGFAIVASLALGLFAPEFIYFLGNPEYAVAGPLVLVLAPALLLAQMYFFAPGFAVAKRTGLQMWISLGSAVVAVAANFWLIGLWGIVGAALATLASAAVFLTLWFVASQRLYPIPVRWLPVAVATAGGVLLGWGAYAAPDAGLAAGIAIKAALLGASVLLVLLVGLVPLRSGLATLRTLVWPLPPRAADRR